MNEDLRMVSAIVSDPDLEFGKEICWLLREFSPIKLYVSTEELGELPSLIKEREPVVLLLGPGWGGKILPFVHEVTKNFPHTGVLLTLKEVSPELKAEVAKTRLIEILNLPLSKDLLIPSLKEIFETSQASLTSQPERSFSPEVTEATNHISKVVTIFGTKGGVGKTVIATNLAVSLAKRMETKIVLIDLDLQFGDVGVMLRLQPKHTLYDVVNIVDDLNPRTMNELLMPYPAGVKVLPAPLEPELADVITPDNIGIILDLLKDSADFVVIDTPPSFNDVVLTALDKSDRICLVTSMDLPSIKSTKQCLQTFEMLNYPPQKSLLVINRADYHLGLDPKEVEKMLGKKAEITIPTDRCVPLSVNRGKPVVLDFPRAQASRGLKNLSEFFIETFSMTPGKKELNPLHQEGG